MPRDSRLVVHHDNGYVWVSDVTGDIEVNSHTGDMIVMLPDPGPYSIDARTRMGSVSSDFIGKGVNQFLMGTHFAYASQAPSRQSLSAHGSRKHHHHRGARRPVLSGKTEEVA